MAEYAICFVLGFGLFSALAGPKTNEWGNKEKAEHIDQMILDKIDDIVQKIVPGFKGLPAAKISIPGTNSYAKIHPWMYLVSVILVLLVVLDHSHWRRMICVGIFGGAMQGIMKMPHWYNVVHPKGD